MQFNSNLVQSFLGQTQKSNASAVESSNMLVTPIEGGGEYSSEFHSLLNETKTLAESGISPEEFIETLNTEDLGLSGNEKKVLTKSFIDALSTEGEEALTPLTGPGTRKVSLSSTGKSNESALAKIIGNGQPTPVLAESINSNNKVTSQQVADTSSEEGLVDTKVDPKITNGKLISLKEHTAKNQKIGNLQTSEDFIAQSKAVSKDVSETLENGERKVIHTNNKNKVLAFNKEQNSINNNIFSGKNPYLSSNESKAIKSSGDGEILTMDQLSSNIKSEGPLAPILNQSNNSSHSGQHSFGNNANVKVLDFTSLGTTNTEQLIDKITNYITTSRLENQEHVELIVKHDSLGQLKLTATKGQLPDQVNLDIVANSEKGHQFFKTNEIEMIKSLSNSGVKLNDVKISMGSDFNFQSSEKGDSQFNQGQGSQSSKYSTQQSSSGHEQGRRDRREQMWNMYRERMGA